MGFATWLFMSVWGRRLLMGAGVVIVLLIIREHYVMLGRQQASEQATQTTIKEETASWQKDRADLMQGLRDATDAIQAATTEIAASRTRQRQIESELAKVKIASQDAAAALAKTPDSDLDAYIWGRLAIRPANDRTAGFYAAEKRALAQCVDEQPLCLQKTDLLSKNIDELHGEVKSQEDKYTGLDSSYRALSTYTVALEGHYVKLVNDFTKPHRAPQCLWLWHCKKTVLAVPSVDEIKRTAKPTTP